MRAAAFLLALLFATSGSSAQQSDADPVQTVPPIYADPALDRLTTNRLETFQSQQDFDAYWRDLVAYGEQRRKRINRLHEQLRRKTGANGGGDNARLASIERGRRNERAGARAQDGYEDVCTDPQCFGAEAGIGEIVVTASRAGASQSSSAP